MSQPRSEGAGEASGPANGAPTSRAIASGKEWSLYEVLCGAGPGDPVFEERHDGFSIAAVVEGAFTYKGERGDALLHPGALLLGNHGRCYSCGHAHAAGDRCIAFNLAPEAFEEIAASAAGSSRFRFGAHAAPASRAATPLVAEAIALARSAAPLRREQEALRLVERVVAFVVGRAPSNVQASAREARRMADVQRAIEQRADQALDLETLAGVARMSKYHFLRVFRRVVGVTPYQFLLSVRLRRVAIRLAGSGDSVSAIAFESGFGDLSTFNAHFRADFGESPSAWRARRRPA